MPAIRAFLFRFGTPLTVGLFLVSAVSGVALFFHVAPGSFREMHEIVSLALLVPVSVHLWRNWNGFLGYFKRAAMPISLALSLAVAAAFAYQSTSPGTSGNPAMAVVSLAQTASLSDLAPVLKLDETAVLQRLEAFGIKEPSVDETIAAIAARSGLTGFDVLAQLTARK